MRGRSRSKAIVRIRFTGTRGGKRVTVRQTRAFRTCATKRTR